MDLTFALLNGGLCVAAFWCAAHFPNGRREACLIALLIFANWLLYISAWTDLSPRDGLKAAGMDISSPDLWMFADALVGFVAVLIARHWWWGWAVWALMILQECIHAGMQFDFYPFESYTYALNWTFWALLSVFFLNGGKGVLDGLRRLSAIRGIRGLRHALSRTRHG